MNWIVYYEWNYTDQTYPDQITRDQDIILSQIKIWSRSKFDLDQVLIWGCNFLFLIQIKIWSISNFYVKNIFRPKIDVDQKDKTVDQDIKENITKFDLDEIVLLKLHLYQIWYI